MNKCKGGNINITSKANDGVDVGAYFGFRRILWRLLKKPLNKGIFSVFGRFIEDFLRNQTCWEKSKNRFGFNDKIKKQKKNKKVQLYCVKTKKFLEKL
jgi:hypothetical protein